MILRQVTRLSTALLLVVGIISGAHGAEHTLGQRNRAFSQPTLTINAGDTVYFINDDDVPHNVVSTSRGNGFDLGEQHPGIETPVTFKSPGDVHVRCLIHPRMQTIIKVAK